GMTSLGWRPRCAVVLIAATFGLMQGASILYAGSPTTDPVATKLEPTRGQFLSGGEKIAEFHCVPKSEGKHPVVMLLHGCAPENFGGGEFRQMCLGLAERGYYAMFIEYYGSAGAPNCRDLAMKSAVS